MEEDFLELAAHVDQCFNCAQAVESLQAADPLTVALRRGPLSNLTPTLDECRIRVRLWCDWDELLQPPCEIGEYQVLEQIGNGGWGLVYRARHARHGEVALKVLRAELVHSEEHCHRFLRESTALQLLDDPRIVSVLDQGAIAGRPYLATRFVVGLDLRRLLASGREPSLPEACCWIKQAAEILAMLHQRGLVHRDIKPSNIMLTEGDQVQLLDFGLARLPPHEDQASLTGEGDIFGTLEYMAPEALASTSQADIRSDLFSLGRTLDQLVRGRAGFRLQSIIDRMQRSDPAQRFQTPAEVAAALAPFAEPRPPMARRYCLAAAMALLALLAIVVWSVTTDSLPFTRSRGSAVIFADSFEDPHQSRRNWYIGLPDIQKPLPPAAVDFVDGHARLRNRASLVSYQHFPEPFALNFKWKWTKGQGTYSDVLAVGLRTSGLLTAQWPFELDQGVLIKFSPALGEVQCIDLDRRDEAGTAQRGVPLPQDEWLTIRITDDGKQISVHLNGATEPALSVPAPHPSKYHRIAIYNREPVGGIEKESLLDDVRIETLQSP